MNRRLLVTAITLIALALMGASAQEPGAAPQEDSLLQRFDLALENLDAAAASVPEDGVEARNELERALNALLTLSTHATSPALVQAMERTFDRTRTAIENQSHTDMIVQTAVLRGGFARIVMDAAFTAAGEGDLPLARSRLRHLAAALEFPQPDLPNLEPAASSVDLRLAFEASAANAINSALSGATELTDENVPAAYRALAGAYGRSLLVQDSPRLAPELNQQLVAAATALVNNDGESAKDALHEAAASVERFAAAARGEVAPATTEPEPATGESPAEQPAPAAVPASEPAPTPTPAGADAERSEDGSEPATSTEQPGQEAPPGEPGSAEEPLPLLGETPAAGMELEAALQNRLNEAEEARRAEALDRLTSEAAARGVPRGIAQQGAPRLLSAGYGTLEEAVTHLESLAARAVAAQRSGDSQHARALIGELRRTYDALLQPLLASADFMVSANTTELLASLEERPVLNPQDVSLLAAQTTAIRGALVGGEPPRGQQLELTVDTIWSTLTGALILIALALLAILPLWLLNLAFGGSNRNWRLVGWALFLLLLPVFYEGLTALAGLLNQYAGVEWLASLASYSAFTTTTGKVVWMFSVLLALLLATFGFYGICVQFGILGGRRRAAPAPTEVPATQESAGTTTIDWDEEF